jgi:hypothetical protein
MGVLVAGEVFGVVRFGLCNAIPRKSDLFCGFINKKGGQ